MYVNYLILTFLSNVFYVWCYSNTTANFTDNNLWLTIVKNCEDDPSRECLKNSFQDYLRQTLDNTGDVEFMNFLKFTKNAINYNKLDDNADHDIANQTGDIGEEDTSLEQISRSLNFNTKKFFMTHDLEIRLPQTYFLGSALKISPRSLDSSGAEIKFEIIPRTLDNAVGEGRTIKKIKEFISERLVWALLAILLVIKLVAVKVLFILPTILGVAAAKKLILKVVLFIFPFLHHLFKFCAYTPYGAKHHIHKHQISHIHEVAHGHHKPHHHETVEVISPHDEGPPHYISSHGKKDSLDPYGYPTSGEASYDKIIHRNDQDQENEIDSWGQGQSIRRPKPSSGGRPLTPTEIENMVLKAEKEALIKSRLQKERQRIQEENIRLQEQLNNALRVQEKLKQQASLTQKLHPSHGFKPNLSLIYASPALLPTLSPPPANSVPAPLSPQFLSPNYLHSSPQLPAQYVPQSQSSAFNVITPQLSKPITPQVTYQMPSQQTQKIPSKFVNQAASQLGINWVGAPSNRASTAQLPTEPSKTAQLALNYIKQQEESQKQQQTQPVYRPTTPSDDFVSEDDLGTVEIVKAMNFKPTAIKKPSVEEQIYKAASITYDEFYSPILEKIDKILNELDFTEEPCRERLICSMYRNPSKFSPHSNLLSAELSRDSKELQKPKTTNSAVIRFYRYVQAARDGQDQRDCIRLYPACVINTES